MEIKLSPFVLQKEKKSQKDLIHCFI